MRPSLSQGLHAGMLCAAAATCLLATGRISVALADTPPQPAVRDLMALSLDELANIDITSVSKKSEPLSDAAAAIYVITHDDIIRSGATTLPEILRLAPNLQVAQVSATSYAITARGFNGTTADKLLVLIDGRSVYTPFYSGVYWDMQDVPPEDIERIEVISGPGATLWGANAVNGVINIITRKSGDTQGGVLQLGIGNLGAEASVQYGGKIATDLSYRAYVKGFTSTNDVTANGADAHDSWNKPQGGFRLDWTPSGDIVTLQGDAYKGSEEEFATSNEAIEGQNVLARWNHTLGNDSALQVQAYYDYLSIVIPNNAGDYLHTYDVEAQHNFSWGSWQQIVWGVGYRMERDRFPSSETSPIASAFFSPESRTLNLGDIFAQDSVALGNSLKLILGIKLEDDPYVGVEPLPSARISWKVTESNLLWAAVSRAVRAPSRLDRDLFESEGPIPILVGGNFQSEKLDAYEMGYRTQLGSDASLSVSTYYNVYQDLRSFASAPGGTLSIPGLGTVPLEVANDMEGDTYGTEIWGDYKVTAWWRLSAGFNWLHENLRVKPGALTLDQATLNGDDPRYQASLRSSFNITSDVAFDLNLRRIAALPDPAVPAYTELGGRIGWKVTKSLEVSLTGDNLLHAHHAEFYPSAVTATTPIVEVGRSYFFNTTWRF